MVVGFRPRSVAALVAVIWGLCFVVVQAGLPAAAPLLAAGLRAGIGGGVLAGWLLLERVIGTAGRPGLGQSSWQGPKRRLPAAPVLVALAIANAAVAFGAMYLAAGQAEAAIASILTGAQPIVLALAGWTMFGERPAPRVTWGLVCAMVGVVLVASASAGATTLEGVVLALLATLAPAAGTIMMRRTVEIDLLATTAAQFLLGAAMLVGLSAVVEPWADVSWSAGAVLGLLVLGILGTGVAYVAWFWALPRMTLAGLGGALFLVPVVGFAGGVLTGDRPSAAELLGAAVLLLGIGLASASGRQELRPGIPTTS